MCLLTLRRSSAGESNGVLIDEAVVAYVCTVAEPGISNDRLDVFITQNHERKNQTINSVVRFRCLSRLINGARARELGRAVACKFKFHKCGQLFIGTHNESSDSTKALGFATGRNRRLVSASGLQCRSRPSTRMSARCERERERYFAYATALRTASGPAYQIGPYRNRSLIKSTPSQLVRGRTS
jgi:hypothetical protein